MLNKFKFMDDQMNMTFKIPFAVKVAAGVSFVAGFCIGLFF